MQAEINELREKTETLKKEKSSLKRANTRMQKQKESLKKTKKETKGALKMKCKVTEKAAQKLQEQNEQYKIQLEERDNRIEEQDQQLEEQKQQMEQDDEDYKKLSDQNLELMGHIAVSSRMDNQKSDETILDAMGYTYTAISDCFYGVLRRQARGQLTGQHSTSEPTTYSGDIDVNLAAWQEDLNIYVPNHKDNTNQDKLQLCIATVGWVLTTVVKKEWVFGYPCTEQIEAATSCWNRLPRKYKLIACRDNQLTHFAEAQNREAQKKLSQWLTLTRDILTDKDEEIMSRTSEALLEEVLDKSQELLEGLTDLKINKSIREELSAAVAPFLEIMCMLPYQRWQYTFDMVRAFDEGDWTAFDPAEMEGDFAGQTGWVKASLFPQLCRIQWDGPDEVSSMEDPVAGQC